MRIAILTACLIFALPGTTPSRADDLSELRARVDELESRVDDLEALRTSRPPRFEMKVPRLTVDRVPSRLDEATRWSRETPAEWRGVPEPRPRLPPVYCPAGALCGDGPLLR